MSADLSDMPVPPPDECDLCYGTGELLRHDEIVPCICEEARLEDDADGEDW